MGREEKLITYKIGEERETDTIKSGEERETENIKMGRNDFLNSHSYIKVINC